MATLNDVLDKLDETSQKPLKFIRKRGHENEETLNTLKETFKLHITRINNVSRQLNKDTPDDIYIGNFKSEQIWQQIELRNNLFYAYVPEITDLLISKDDLKFPYSNIKCNRKKSKHDLNEKKSKITNDEVHYSEEDEVESSDESLNLSFDEVAKQLEETQDNSENENEVENQLEGTQDESENENEDETNDQCEDENELGMKKKHKSSDAKDKDFFSMDKMEEFLNEAEKDGVVDDIDYFTDVPSDEDDEENPKYDDFFKDSEEEDGNRVARRGSDEEDDMSEGSDEEDIDTQSQRMRQDDKDIGSNKKKVKFMLNSESSDEDEKGNKPYNQVKSSFEMREEKLRDKITKLEERALGEKPWPLRGEVDGSGRPINSLLEEVVDVDLTIRPPPVITEQVTSSLENLITTRIRDRAFDDVLKKIKPIHVPHELKKELVLNQEKSKVSLAEIYEQEYVNQKQAATAVDDGPTNEMTPEKIKLKDRMTALFWKLDTLSNFHFTPKPRSASLQIVNNMPAIAVEEAIPTAMSDGSTLAPQEITANAKKHLIGKDERNKTDKKRERRQKKSFQAAKHKRLAQKEGVSAKKLLKARNISTVHAAADETAVKSSTKFFTRLQENTEAGVKPKTINKTLLMKAKKK